MSKLHNAHGKFLVGWIISCFNKFNCLSLHNIHVATRHVCQYCIVKTWARALLTCFNPLKTSPKYTQAGVYGKCVSTGLMKYLVNGHPWLYLNLPYERERDVLLSCDVINLCFLEQVVRNWGSNLGSLFIWSPLYINFHSSKPWYPIDFCNTHLHT